MRSPPDAETPPLHQGGGASKIDRLPGSISDTDNHSPAQPQLEYHAEHLFRRRKTNEELIAGCEFVALAERRRRA
jgi:hypothetical protein